MLVLIASILLALLFIAELLAVQDFASSIKFLVFIDAWFAWLFALITFMILFGATKRIFFALIISAIVGLILRLLL